MITKKKKRVKLVPIPKLLKKAEIVFNRFIRTRDSEDGYFKCISDGNIYPTELMDAGHYVPKTCSFLRFNEDNVHGESKKCNAFDSFHLIGYRKNLIEKIGEEKVNWLEENKRTVKTWTRDELLEIILKYSK